jgi:homoserine O-acetyltransferase
VLQKIFKADNSFTLESGVTLPGYHLAYTTYGQLNEDKNNAIWIFHALTANSDAAEWWPGLVGEEKFFNPSKYFVVCVNMPGSCYGSLGPLDISAGTNEPYYHDFPFFTTRDMIHSFKPLRKFLGIEKIHIGIGGSMGGQQLLEWAIEEPDLFEYIFPIATNAFHSSWGVAFNTTQRMSIEADATWKQKNAFAGINGMKAARACALLSYRSYQTYTHSQPVTSLKIFNDTDHFIREEIRTGAASYQRYQGEKLAKRFNAFSYYFLSMGMDSHNVGRGRSSAEAALQKIKAKALVIGIVTDILFPLNEQQFIATNIAGAEYKAIHSLYGHDGFLLEFEQIENLLKNFILKEAKSTLITQDIYKE